MNNLNESQKAELEDKIREAVPESMDHNFILSGEVCNQCSLSKEVCGLTQVKCNGRKLNLQDVLIALGEVTSKHQDWYYFDTSGNLLIHGWHQTRVNSSPEEVFYNLTKNYHEQEEEFYIFLYQLLINE